METVIKDYISRELVRDPALLPVADETSLLESGILDSLSLLQLVVFLEGRFGITVGDADLLPENFDTVNAICAYLRSLAACRLPSGTAWHAAAATGFSRTSPASAPSLPATCSTCSGATCARRRRSR